MKDEKEKKHICIGDLRQFFFTIVISFLANGNFLPL